MRVLQVNIFGNLSTGRIAVDIYKTLIKNGAEGCVAYARNTIEDGVQSYVIGSSIDVKVHGIMTRLTDKTGFYSKKATVKFIEFIEDYKPDIIHLHNIHGYYLNIELLFNYLKKTNIPVVWTLHDCWAYTGHCCYYSMAQCNRWMTGCHDCPQKNAYPASKLIDNSKWNYQKKKELFLGVNMTLVTVSQWLADETKKSFLNAYPIKTIYNGVDLNVFKPTESNFRERYSIGKRKVILGVASTWDTRKGLRDFIKLASMLGDEYRIVIVGVTESETKNFLPNMIGIKRTNSVQELGEIYTAADVFLNASVEETFGLPTVEAMACGTPVIVYNATALPEVVDETCGFIVEPHDFTSLVDIIKNKKYELINSDSCRKQAIKFEKYKQYEQYIDLYREISGLKTERKSV